LLQKNRGKNQLDLESVICRFFEQNLDLYPDLPKILDPDPYLVNPNPKQWEKVLSAKLNCGWDFAEWLMHLPMQQSWV
jgi:hypothetical protein